MVLGLAVSVLGVSDKRIWGRCWGGVEERCRFERRMVCSYHGVLGFGGASDIFTRKGLVVYLF